MECVSCVTIDLCQKWKKTMVGIFHILCPCTGTETADTCDCDLIQRNFYTRFQQFPEWKFLHEDSWNPSS